ncbi:MAG: gamma-glutamylcyclotransferase family protein [Actinomycetales bacterium]
MTYYAAYGANMHPEQMLLRAPHSPVVGTGWLQGWRLTFAGGDAETGALPTIVEDRAAGAAVYIALYDITSADEHVLDQWEGTDSGLYRKIKVRVDLLSGQETAWIYVLDDYEGGLPTPQRISLIAEAAEAAGAPAEYVSDLLQRPCSGRD